MAYSVVNFTANGSANNFAIPFDFISASHIKALVNGSVRPFSVINGNQVRFNSVPGAGSLVIIFRSTPLEPLVTFSGSSVLTADELNLANRQALYITQEQADQINGLAPTDQAAVLSDLANQYDDITASIAMLNARIQQLQMSVGGGSNTQGEIRSFFEDLVPAGWQPLYTREEPHFIGAKYTLAHKPTITKTFASGPVISAGTVGHPRASNELVVGGVDGAFKIQRATITEYLQDNFTEIVTSFNASSQPILRASVGNKVYFTANTSLYSANFANLSSTIERSLTISNIDNTRSLDFVPALNSLNVSPGDVNSTQSEIKFYGTARTNNFTNSGDVRLYYRYNFNTGEFRAQIIAATSLALRDELIARADEFPALLNPEFALAISDFSTHIITSNQVRQIYDSRFLIGFKNTNDVNAPFNLPSGGRWAFLAKVNNQGYVIHQEPLNVQLATVLAATSNAHTRIGTQTFALAIQSPASPNGVALRTYSDSSIFEDPSFDFSINDTLYPIEVGNPSHLFSFAADGFVYVGATNAILMAIPVNLASLGGASFGGSVVEAYKL